MKTILITGASGFAAGHLIDILLETENIKIIGIHRSGPNNKPIIWEKADLLNRAEINEIIKKYKPDEVYHMAAISRVGELQKDPVIAIETNVVGTANLLQSILENSPESRILNIGSCEEYGKVKVMPITEDSPLLPYTAYGLSKKMQEDIAQYYESNYGLKMIYTRTFHSTAPGQKLGFVFTDFISQIINLKNKNTKILKVGNLEAKRDYLDTRDSVSAYKLIMEKGQIGEKYNVSSASSTSIKDYLDMMLKESNSEVKIEIDPSKLRPIDIPDFIGDNSKIKALGWKPKYEIRETIKDLFKYLSGD